MSIEDGEFRCIQLSSHRVATDPGRVAAALARALSAPGSHRRTFGPGNAADPDRSVRRVHTVRELVDELRAPALVTMVSGHGGTVDGTEHTEWCLLTDDAGDHVDSGGWIAATDVTAMLGGDLIPTRLLILDQCHSALAAEHWRAVLPADAVLLAAPGVITGPAAARWVSTILTTFAAFTGETPLTGPQVLAACETARDCLALQSRCGGERAAITDKLVIFPPTRDE